MRHLQGIMFKYESKVSNFNVVQCQFLVTNQLLGDPIDELIILLIIQIEYNTPK